MLKLPRKGEREYIAAYGIVAIYVAALPADAALVGHSRDLLHSLLSMRRSYAGAHIHSAYWVRDKTEARLICREVNSSLAQGCAGLVIASAKTAQRQIENIAAHMGITLTEHALVLNRARDAVSYIEAMIDQAQASGELSWFNRAYRQWRLEAKQQGRVMSYAEARARLRQNLFRQMLSDNAQTSSNRLFPSLPGIDFPVSG